MQRRYKVFMGLKLLQSKFRAWALLVVAVLMFGPARGSAYESPTILQQEKTNQEKQDSKPVASSDKKTGESDAQQTDSSLLAPPDTIANDSGTANLKSQIKSGGKFEFKPLKSEWKPWGVTSPQGGTEPGRPPSFSLYFMSEYRRDEIKYTGKPTLTLQFPSAVPPFSVSDPPINFVPSAFEPNDEQFVSYFSATIKDFGIGRLKMDTQVSLRYSADLDGTSDASPFLGIRDNFGGRHIFEPLTFFTDIKGIMPASSETQLSLRVGRQYAYSATPLRMDGATLSINNPRFTLDIFGGRRATFYSDPAERGVVGENFVFRATDHTTVRYDFAHYIDNVHNLEVRHLLGESWILNGSLFMINADPVDLNLGATYISPGARTRVTINLLQKLTSNDFIYDQSFRAVAQNLENQFKFRFFPLPPTGELFDASGRLNLGEIHPYTQIYVDAYRNLTQKIGIGGTAWIRQQNSSDDEGPFDNSFQEFHVNADYFPSSAFEVGTEYRFRHLNRENPNNAQLFNDISREGEKIFHEVYANATYHFPGNRLSLEGGLFYRRFDTQSRLISLDGMDTISYSAGVKWRVARDYKLSFEYGFDRELAFLNPDIDYTQGFRVRFEWRFNR